MLLTPSLSICRLSHPLPVSLSKDTRYPSTVVFPREAVHVTLTLEPVTSETLTAVGVEGTEEEA